MGVSKNRGGPPKSSILIGFSIINHPFWGFSPYFWFNTHMSIFVHGGLKSSHLGVRVISNPTISQMVFRIHDFFRGGSEWLKG